MKVILFLIIIAVIYFIALQIKVVHTDTLPKEYHDKFSSQSQMKDIQCKKNLLDAEYRAEENYQENFQPITQDTNQENHFPIFHSDQSLGGQEIGGYINRYELPVRVKLDIDNADTQKLCHKTIKPCSKENPLWLRSLPDATNLVELVKNEFMDPKYRFNIASLPVTTRYSNTHTYKLDKKYLKHVRNNIKSWNEIFDSYCKGDHNLITIREIKPIFVMETDHEFVIKVCAKILYQEKTMHLELTYYGEMDKKDDFIDWGCDTYIIQLLAIRPVIKSEYNHTIEAINAQPESNGPFMSMKDQMTYVDRINKMHQEEIYNF